MLHRKEPEGEQRELAELLPAPEAHPIRSHQELVPEPVLPTRLRLAPAAAELPIHLLLVPAMVARPIHLTLVQAAAVHPIRLPLVQVRSGC